MDDDLLLDPCPNDECAANYDGFWTIRHHSPHFDYECVKCGETWDEGVTVYRTPGGYKTHTSKWCALAMGGSRQSPGIDIEDIIDERIAPGDLDDVAWCRYCADRQSVEVMLNR